MQDRKIRREFDLDLKLDLVKQIDTGKLKVSEVSSIYGVSHTAVYKWLRKYSQLYRHQTRMVLEKKSIGKKTKDLQSRIKELESALGRKQMRIDYLEQIIDRTSDRLGEDIEKKNKPLS